MRQTINHLVPSFGTLKLILFLLMSPNTLSNMEKKRKCQTLHTHTHETLRAFLILNSLKCPSLGFTGKTVELGQRTGHTVIGTCQAAQQALNIKGQIQKEKIAASTSRHALHTAFFSRVIKARFSLLQEITAPAYQHHPSNTPPTELRHVWYAELMNTFKSPFI